MVAGHVRSAGCEENEMTEKKNPESLLFQASGTLAEKEGFEE